LNTPPAAAVHNMATARKAKKQTQVGTCLKRWRSSKRAMDKSAGIDQQLPAWEL
jgi:hypothetical protein